MCFSKIKAIVISVIENCTTIQNMTPNFTEKEKSGLQVYCYSVP